MASLNKVILIGNLGRDPEILTFENGNKKMSVSLATSESYRDRNGNWVEQTEWHNLVAFGMLAQDVAEKRRNYSKGDHVYVEGRIKTRQYVDNQNITRYITEINVDKMMSLGGSKSQQNPNASYYDYAQQQQYSQYQQPTDAQQQYSQYQQPMGAQQQYSQYQQTVDSQLPNPEYDGDDLPF
ncbi:MAG: single-stranded DNA-binding protein [Candidatus Limimorpha sp.]